MALSGYTINYPAGIILRIKNNKMETSNFLSVDARDLGKGLIVSVGGALVSGIYSAIQAGLATAHVTVNWSLIRLNRVERRVVVYR